MSGFEPQNLSGMAGEIRRCVDSEQFDLAGYTEQRVTDLMVSAFGTPLTAPTKMVRFTFIVGGGKLVRSKYNEDMPKWINTALRSISFVSDNSAAETFDSQGMFKQQHDTGKNLIYIIVFPKVTCSTPGSTESTNEKDSNSVEINTNSPEYLCTASELQTFKEIVQKKLSFWSQRKACLKVLQDAHERFLQVEQKMVSGQPLTAEENAIFESNSNQDAEKIAYLQAEIKALVDSGELTASEKAELLQTLNKNLAEAKSSGQDKKAEGIAARKAALENVKPIVGRLRLGEEIQKRYMKLFPLLALEEKARSMSLTIADLQTLSEKPELEEQIQGLQSASKGWFEREEDFLLRCEFEEKSAKARYLEQKSKQVKKAGGSLGGSKSTGTNALRGTNVYANASSWSNIGKKGPVSSAGRSSTGGPAGSSSSKVASFANAFGGDDSD